MKSILPFLLLIEITTSSLLRNEDDFNNMASLIGAHREKTFFKIASVPLPANPIEKTKVKASLLYFEESLEVILAKREKKYAHFDSSLIQSMKMGTMQLRPTKFLAREWKEKNICESDENCLYKGECYGVDAARCLSKHSGRKSTALKKSHTENVSPWRMLWTPTCVMSIVCDWYVTSLPIHQNKSDVGRPYTYDFGGTPFPVEEMNTTKGKEITEDWTAFTLNNNKINEYHKDIELLCLDKGRENIHCSYPHYRKPSQKVIVRLDPNKLEATHLNMKVNVDSITVREKGGMVILRRKGNSIVTESHQEKLEENRGKPASLEDVLMIKNEMLYLNQESKYNEYRLTQSIKALYEVLNKMIKSISMIDDHLIGDVMGRSFNTKWITPSTFAVTHRETEKGFGSSNCEGHRIFKEGRILEKNDGDTCFNIAGERVTSMKVFKDDDGVLDTVEDLIDPDISASGWSGWTTLMRKVLDDLVPDDSKDSNLEGDTSSGIGIPSIFGSPPFILSIVAIVLSILSLMISCMNRK
uniref:Uncharacterized protein n=2 Tax=root TaxID=1 RepID=A0A1Y1MB94_PHOPY|nr:HA [Photinus pyralis orthomyxo-like virus 1]